MDKIPNEILKMLRKEAEIIYKPNSSDKELEEAIEKAEILIVRSRKINKNLLSKAKRLKLVIRAGHGTDNIDTETAEKLGIEIKATGGSTEAVAELTIALILALLRKLIQANNSLKSGLWLKYQLIGRELMGKTVGIIGFGRIGRRVAELVKAFGAKVICYDPYIENYEENVEFVSLQELLKKADIITLHAPLTSETIKMIGEEEISMIKENAIIVNTARGALIDEKILAKAIRSGKLGGVALDVFSEEPATENEIVTFNADNIIVTPHIGAQTIETWERIGRKILEYIREFKKKHGM